MSGTRRILLFVVPVLVLYVLLLMIWPLFAHPYGSVFRTLGGRVFGSFGSNGVVKFVASPQEVEGGVHENTMYLWRSDRPNAIRKVTNSTRFVGYVPTALVVSLVLSTPIPWLRRLRALLWALIMVHVFIVLRVGMVLSDVFTGTQPWCLYDPSPMIKSILHTSAAALSNSPPISYMIPVLIWIMATIRRADLALIMGSVNPESVEPPPPTATQRD